MLHILAQNLTWRLKVMSRKQFYFRSYFWKIQNGGYHHFKYLFNGYSVANSLLHALAQNHRRAVAQHCINGDSLSQWRRAKFDPPQNGDPWTDCQKIWRSWLRLGGDPLCQISCKSVHGGFSANAWNITEIFLIYTFFQKLTYRADRLMYFHVQWLKRRGLTQGCAFLGLQSPKSIFNTWKIPKNVKIWPKRDLEIFRPNTACMKFS